MIIMYHPKSRRKKTREGPFEALLFDDPPQIPNKPALTQRKAAIVRF